MLTGSATFSPKDDPFGAVDLDHCRCTITNSIDVWAQNYSTPAVILIRK